MNVLAVIALDADIIWVLAVIMIALIFMAFYTKIKIFSFFAGLISIQIAFALSDYIILLITMLFLTIYLIYYALWSD